MKDNSQVSVLNPGNVTTLATTEHTVDYTGTTTVNTNISLQYPVFSTGTLIFPRTSREFERADATLRLSGTEGNEAWIGPRIDGNTLIYTPSPANTATRSLSYTATVTFISNYYNP